MKGPLKTSFSRSVIQADRETNKSSSQRHWFCGKNNKLELQLTFDGIEIKIDLKAIRQNCVCLLRAEREEIVPALGLVARFAECDRQKIVAFGK